MAETVEQPYRTHPECRRVQSRIITSLLVKRIRILKYTLSSPNLFHRHDCSLSPAKIVCQSDFLN